MERILLVMAHSRTEGVNYRHALCLLPPVGAGHNIESDSLADQGGHRFQLLIRIQWRHSPVGIKDR